ncbi:MAG TPA: hypothetical protein VGG97_23810 [Bryobacteraceae bacterium]
MKYPTAPETPAKSSSNSAIDIATLELLARWQRQDATDDPEEIHAAEQELAEFKKITNETRTLAGERILYP